MLENLGSHRREEISGRFHINALVQRSAEEDRRPSPRHTERLKRAPLRVTKIAPNFIVSGRKIISGVGKRDHPKSLPPITARGLRIHIPLVMVRSSSLAHKVLEA